MKKYFDVNVNKYLKEYEFSVYRPASLDKPCNNSVMMVTAGYVNHIGSLNDVQNCLIFWPKDIMVPEEILMKHAVVKCANPHLEYCRFFQTNKITNNPPLDEFELIKGAYIVKGAVIGEGATIFPGVYIGSEVTIGKNVFIGSGTRILGKITIGDEVIIRENSVIGADGLSTDRDENGKAVTMPQFGGVFIGDDVQIGANTVIGRGAIDDTIISSGSKIDNCCFISHNVFLGADTFVVGETIMFGSSSTGEQAYISGNATIRNGIHIGAKSIVGMGAVVTKAVPDNAVVAGNPAKKR